MASVLILTPDAASRAALSLLVEHGGHVPLVSVDGEAPDRALDRTRADVVMVDTELGADSAFTPMVRRTGALLLYFTSALSAYELATYARRQGASHFPLASGAPLLRAVIEEWVSQRQEFGTVVLERPASIAMQSARSSVSRARALVARSHRVVERATILRVRNRIALAVLSGDGEVIAGTLRDSAAVLHRAGLARERSMEVLRDEVGRMRFTRAVLPPEWDALERWCDDLYSTRNGA